MSDVKALAEMMKELEDQLTVCMKCGMCQAVCPLYERTGREADVARGKLALLDGLGREILDDPEGVSERLGRCLLCGSCAANCPSGVSVLEIFIKARAILAGYMGLSPAKRAILRGMLARPGVFDRMAEWGGRFQAALTKPVNDMIGTSCARFMSPLIGDRHFRPLAATPFHRRISALDESPSGDGPRVAFFVGCLLDKFFPSVAEAAVTVLRRHGAGIFMPEGQACCGIPAISAGDTKSFHRLVLHNLERFEGAGFDVLVTACATCTSTIKKIWPLMVRDQPEAVRKRVGEITERTQDINRFLVERFGITPAKSPAKERRPVITYHDPCHLKKSLGVFSEPRTLIGANPGYRLEEMAQSDWCCGMGGSFNLQYYETSAAIGQKKRNNIHAVAPAAVATGCPACMLQISDMLSRAGDRVRIRHPVEIYAETLDPAGSSP